MSKKNETLVQLPDSPECPICLDELDITDQCFIPCKCGYQLCRFCFNRVNENHKGKCPACRQPYKTENFKFTPPQPEEIQRLQNAKKAKERERKAAEVTARKKLADVRVIQRNLVYVTNLPLNTTSEDVLERNDHFGKFGKIKKIVVNKSKYYQSPDGPSVSAYITYGDVKDAFNAIKGIDGMNYDGRVLRASFGATKYCLNFLKSLKCPIADCMYLHELGPDEDTFSKDDMAKGKHLFFTIENEDKQNITPIKSNQKDTSKNNINNQSMAWKTSSCPGQLISLNPDEWPDALSGAITTITTKKRNKSKTKSPNNEPEQTVTKSALPATASWASKTNNTVTETSTEERLKTKEKVKDKKQETKAHEPVKEANKGKQNNNGSSPNKVTKSDKNKDSKESLTQSLDSIAKTEPKKAKDPHPSHRKQTETIQIQESKKENNEDSDAKQIEDSETEIRSIEGYYEAEPLYNDLFQALYYDWSDSMGNNLSPLWTEPLPFTSVGSTQSRFDFAREENEPNMREADLNAYKNFFPDLNISFPKNVQFPQANVRGNAQNLGSNPQYYVNLYSDMRPINQLLYPEDQMKANFTQRHNNNTAKQNYQNSQCNTITPNNFYPSRELYH